PAEPAAGRRQNLRYREQNRRGPSRAPDPTCAFPYARGADPNRPARQGPPTKALFAELLALLSVAAVRGRCYGLRLGPGQTATGGAVRRRPRTVLTRSRAGWAPI